MQRCKRNVLRRKYIASRVNFVRRFMNATLFSEFSALILFNHLTDRICSFVEIIDERHDGPLGDNLEDAEVMPDYIREEDKSTFV